MTQNNLDVHEKKHYWCEKCGIPLLQEHCNNCGENSRIEIPDDIKPVFQEEYKYYLNATKRNLQISDVMFPKVLYRARNYLYSDISKGVAHFRIKTKADQDSQYAEYIIEITNANAIPSKRSRIRNFFLENEDYLKKLIQGNLESLVKIEKEALDFIKRVSQKYKDHYQISSFSGGKDSTVTANLVRDAIGKKPIVYSDTGIEFELTKEYVKTHGPFFGELVYLDKQVNFMDVCEKLGPPSRTMRWCCFTSKGAPLSKYYAEMEHSNVLSFDGIRARESNARSLLSRERDNTKYEKQFSAYPILDWTTLEVWLYIFWKKIPYNPLYDHGFARVGCWACPNNTQFDWFLASQVYPKMVKDWFQFIYDYGQDQNKKMDDDERKYEWDWIQEGHWKKRRVKYNTTDNLASIKEDNGNIVVELNNDTPDVLKEFLKVFGSIEVSGNQNSSEIKIRSKKIQINYMEGQKSISINIPDEKFRSELKKLVIRQINKAYNCINCGACAGSCPKGAISIFGNETNQFQIDTDKCINCLICTGTKYIEMSCIAIHYKEDRIYINLREI